MVKKQLANFPLVRNFSNRDINSKTDLFSRPMKNIVSNYIHYIQ